MSQNNLVLPTTGTISGLTMTQDINAALDTLNTLNSGGSAPSTPEAFQLWADSTNNQLKLRNEGNTAWIALFSAILGISMIPQASPDASVLVSTASASATFTASTVIAATALGGTCFPLSNFSQSINLATTGAGGMDTGTAPASGYVALYAIYNPVSNTPNILATDATSAAQPPVYGGGNMPSGYTASALLGVVPTNPSRQITPGKLNGRRWAFSEVSVYNANGAVTTTTLSISVAVPINAKRCGGGIVVSNTNASASGLVSVYSNTLGFCRKRCETVLANGGNTLSNSFDGLEIVTPQQIAFSVSAGTGTPGTNILIASYEV